MFTNCVLITSAGEGDADTWMMSMIHVKKGVEVCNLCAHVLLSLKYTKFQAAITSKFALYAFSVTHAEKINSFAWKVPQIVVHTEQAP
jgi:hypothetical protein